MRMNDVALDLTINYCLCVIPTIDSNNFYFFLCDCNFPKIVISYIFSIFIFLTLIFFINLSFMNLYRFTHVLV